MAHVLVYVAARVVPEEAPVYISVRVEVVLFRFTLKLTPDDVLGRHIGVRRPRPLGLAVRSVAVHVHVHRGDLAHAISAEELHSIRNVAGGARLVTDLHDPVRAGFPERHTHALCVVDRKRHRLFLITMLTGIHHGGEGLAVEMLGRGYEDRIDVLIFKEVPVVQVSFGVRREFFRVLETACIDIREGNEVGVWTRYGFASDLRSAVTNSDDAEPNAVVGSEYAA